MSNPHGSFPKREHKSFNHFKTEIGKIVHKKKYSPDILSYDNIKIHMERNRCIINRRKNYKDNNDIYLSCKILCISINNEIA